MHPTFESWLEACKMMRRESARFRSYIQWYPFARLSKASWDLLESQNYFDCYIKDGAFILSKHMRFRTRGCILDIRVRLRSFFWNTMRTSSASLSGTSLAVLRSRQVPRLPDFYANS